MTKNTASVNVYYASGTEDLTLASAFKGMLQIEA